jgi:hypothetical protein
MWQQLLLNSIYLHLGTRLGFKNAWTTQLAHYQVE